MSKTTTTVQKHVTQFLEDLLAKAEPHVCAQGNEVGLDIYFPARSHKRVFTLLNEAQEIVPNPAAVGSMSVRRKDAKDNNRRIECESYEEIAGEGGAWWSIALIEMHTAKEAEESTMKLQEAGIPAIQLSTTVNAFKNPAAQAALQAIIDYKFKPRGREIPGVERPSKPRYKLDQLIVIYAPSGGEQNSTSLWTNKKTDTQDNQQASSGSTEMLLD